MFIMFIKAQVFFKLKWFKKLDFYFFSLKILKKVCKCMRVLIRTNNYYCTFITIPISVVSIL